jgi:class 3 adenylate cyclase
MASHAWVVVGSDTPDERTVPVEGRLLVGRECLGADRDKCLIVEDPLVSRDHLEIRTDPSGDPILVDLSLNGTRVNGRRVEPAEPITLRDGDRIELGATQLRFRAAGEAALPASLQGSTVTAVGSARLAIVVGDIIGYTTMTEQYGGVAVADVVRPLFDGLRRLVRSHGGTISNYVGDAISAAWDYDHNPAAPADGVSFALAANELVTRRAASTAIDLPLRMGWAVTLGEAAIGWHSPSREAIHGDAVNLAFRLASIAGREGNPPVLAADEVALAAANAADYGEPRQVHAKGRTTAATVRAAERRA